MTIKDLIKRKKEDDHIRVVSPVVNIQEQETCILLHAEMPGIEKQQLTVEVHGDELCIEAKKTNIMPQGYTVFMQERMPVEYKRVFNLGRQINKEAVSARYDKGVLTVELKKLESAQPKKITIM